MLRFVKMLSSLLGRGPGFEYSSMSERGQVRSENQDSFHVSPDGRLFCVADGMGGGEGGAKASEIACETIAEKDGAARDFTSRLRAVSDAIVEANSAVRAFAARAGYKQMATTVTAMLFDDSRKCALIAYVGDSRVYRCRGGKIARLTHDHTLAGELGRRTISPSMLAKIPGGIERLSHILTRAVGIERDVQAEWRKVDVRDGDVFLVCTDGVYDMVGEEDIAASIASNTSCRKAAESLASKIENAGAADNYTMIVVKAGSR